MSITHEQLQLLPTLRDSEPLENLATLKGMLPNELKCTFKLSKSLLCEYACWVSHINPHAAGEIFCVLHNRHSDPVYEYIPLEYFKENSFTFTVIPEAGRKTMLEYYDQACLVQAIVNKLHTVPYMGSLPTRI